MNFQDEARLRGSFEIRVFKARREIEHYRDENMIMASARDALARLIGGDGAGKTVTKIGVGTNGDGPTPDDKGLTGAYSKAVVGAARIRPRVRRAFPSPSAQGKPTAKASVSSDCSARTGHCLPARRAALSKRRTT